MYAMGPSGVSSLRAMAEMIYELLGTGLWYSRLVRVSDTGAAARDWAADYARATWPVRTLACVRGWSALGGFAGIVRAHIPRDRADGFVAYDETGKRAHQSMPLYRLGVHIARFGSECR